MKIDNLSPDDEITKELGRRLAKVRRLQGYAQQQLADVAGVGVATLRRIEGGQDSHMQSWLKILKALGLTQSIDKLLPENFSSPMADALADRSRRRKRKSVTSIRTWGDGQT